MAHATALSRFDHVVVLMLTDPSFADLSGASSLGALARGFAVCGHGACVAPRQTFCNRSFFHAGTSGGQLTDAPFAHWSSNADDTLFNRLEAKGITWAIYYDEQDVFPLTLLVHFPRLWPYFKTNFHPLDHFYADAARGTLPSYAVVEPRLFVGYDGRRLIDDVYGAVRDAQTRNGSNFSNTLLAITCDCAGRDDPRVSTLMVSGWTSPGHAVGAPFEPTSMLKTLEMKWGLEPLTRRDAAAGDFLEVFDRPVVRDRSEWPVLAPLEPPAGQDGSSLDQPLDTLQTAIVAAVHALETGVRSALPENPTVGDAIDFMRRKKAELEVL